MENGHPQDYRLAIIRPNETHRFDGRGDWQAILLLGKRPKTGHFMCYKNRTT